MQSLGILQIETEKTMEREIEVTIAYAISAGIFQCRGQKSTNIMLRSI